MRVLSSFLLLGLLASCSHGGDTADGNVGDASASADGSTDDVTVVIAAAGDISDAALTSQKATSDLVLAGHYDAVLTLGDNQYNSGDTQDFANYFDPTWGRFKQNIFPATGNHEYAVTRATGYFDYFFSNGNPVNPRINADGGAADPTRGYYSYDLGAWHIIALNTNAGATEDGACGVIGCDAGSAQEEWLKADLEAHKDTRCVLAYWHQARFTAGGHANDVDLAPIWADLYQWNADVVLNGHDHDYQRFAPMNADGGADAQNGIVEFVVGTGGTHVSNETSSTPSTLVTHENPNDGAGTGFGILQLTLHSTSYDWKFIGVPGTTFTDEGNGTCH